MRVFFTDVTDVNAPEKVSFECTEIKITETGLELYDIFTDARSTLNFKDCANMTISKA